MKKPLKNYCLTGILFVSIAGTLSHFIYGWTGHNPAAALFTPVNESTWEHMKLLYFPMLAFTLPAAYLLRHRHPCALPAFLSGNLFGCLLIPTLFYTYTGILGFHTLPLDIAVFLFSVIAAFCAAYYLTPRCPGKYGKALLYLLSAALFAAFLAFTYFPPSIGLFASP